MAAVATAAMPNDGPDDGARVVAAGQDVVVAELPADNLAGMNEFLAADRAAQAPFDAQRAIDAAAEQAGADQAAAEEAAAEQAAAEQAAAEQAAAPEASTGSHWDRLADCESGDWDSNGNPISGSARWDYGVNFSHGDIFEGGVNFHPGTWDAYRSGDMPAHAGSASRSQQIAVAEQVLAAQGWGAWPVCSRKIGLR